jgi:hypothetical protein
MTTTEQIEVINNLQTPPPVPFQKKELHKCPYCDNTCFGIQCKQCHLKMLEAQQGTCTDCNELFHAVRKDGSKRRRCISCQTVYNEKYISKCPICSSSYHACLDDGRFFDKCFSCYKKSFHQCSNCDRSTKIDYDLCKVCYQAEKKMKYVNNNYANNNRFIYTENNFTTRKIPNELELFKCEVTGCSNISSTKICTQCA